MGKSFIMFPVSVEMSARDICSSQRPTVREKDEVKSGIDCPQSRRSWGTEGPVRLRMTSHRDEGEGRGGSLVTVLWYSSAPVECHQARGSGCGQSLWISEVEELGTERRTGRINWVPSASSGTSLELKWLHSEFFGRWFPSASESQVNSSLRSS